MVGRTRLSKRSVGQMFILATIVIAAYCMIITSVLLQVQMPPASTSSSVTLQQVYYDVRREVDLFLRALLARYTSGGPPMTGSQATIDLLSFLHDSVEMYASQRGVDLSMTLKGSVVFEGNQSPVANVVDVANYSASVSASFSLTMRQIYGGATIYEDLVLGHRVVAAVGGSRVRILAYDGNGNLLSGSIDAVVAVGAVVAVREPNGTYFFSTGLPAGTLNATTQGRISVYS
jgi:hypothetical protein